MNPTLCWQDLLEIEPYGDRPVRLGDVIVFMPPDDGLPVVHRIIKLITSGVRTCGDGNAGADRYLVQPADITGRVVAAWRGNQRRKIPGGRVALFRVNLSRRWQIIDQLIGALLYPLYVTLACSGITRCLLPAYLHPRVVDFQAGDRHQLRLLFGRHMIGHYEDNLGCWIIRRPFRLFVDERLLPSPRSFGKSHPESIQCFRSQNIAYQAHDQQG